MEITIWIKPALLVGAKQVCTKKCENRIDPPKFWTVKEKNIAVTRVASTQTFLKLCRLGYTRRRSILGSPRPYSTRTSNATVWHGGSHFPRSQFWYILMPQSTAALPSENLEVLLCRASQRRTNDSYISDVCILVAVFSSTPRSFVFCFLSLVARANCFPCPCHHVLLWRGRILQTKSRQTQRTIQPN